MTLSCETGRDVCEPGYTLLELLVVLAIMALASLVVIQTSVGGSERQNIQSVGESLGSRLVETRLAAIRDGAARTVTLVPRSCALRIGGSNVPLGCRENTVVTLSNPQSAAGDDSGKVVFHEDGSSSGGDFSISGQSLDLHVRLDWLTGEVRIDDPVLRKD